MEWIKSFFSYNIRNIDYNLDGNKNRVNKEFEKENNNLILVRIKFVCIAIIILSAYYAYIDFVIFKELEGTYYLRNLRVMHLIIILGCFLYLGIYEFYLKKNKYIKDKHISFVIKTYLISTLLVGMLSSLNSQYLTGNIDSYIIVCVLVAVALPLEPIFMFCAFFINHAMFIVGLNLIVQDKYEVVTKEINSTMMVIMTYVLVVISYRFRKNDYYNKSNLEKLFEINPYPLIIERFKDGKIIKVNKKILEFYDISLEESKNLTEKDLYSNNGERNNIIKRLENEGNIYNYILEHKTKDGLSKWVIANYEVINYRGEKCILCGMTDITELKKMESELIKNATTDVLTGVYNRRTGMEILQKKLTSDSKEFLELSICFIDINKLKYVNDNYGHAEGDYYISTVCRVLKSEINKDDILFRFGGDEFIIAFIDKSSEEVEKIWADINLKFKNINNSNHKPYDITVSHGVYQYNSNMQITLEEVIHLADEEMYKDKYCKI